MFPIRFPEENAAYHVRLWYSLAGKELPANKSEQDFYSTYNILYTNIHINDKKYVGIEDADQ